MRRYIRMLVAAGGLAAIVAVGQPALAGPGPLTPIKYHDIEVGPYVVPVGGSTLTISARDTIDPSGHKLFIAGALDDNVVLVVPFFYTIATGTAGSDTNLVIDPDGAGGDDPLAALRVQYTKVAKVFTITISGVVGGESFALPPIVIG